jgi:hypothetical protein
MTETTSNLLWTQPEWIEEAHNWIDLQLLACGYTRTSSIEQFHVRIWSTVMRFTTDAGLIYFKASHSPKEVRLTVFLREIQPENAPDLLAVDLERGWMLMRDAGQMLRTHLKSPENLNMAEPALVQFARLQITVFDQSEELLSLGSLDHRLHRLPEMFAEMLSEPDILRIGNEDGLTDGQHRQLQATHARYTEMCEQLQTYKVPQSLHHDDFHDGNIFVHEQKSRFRFVFSDWEESCLTHPFFSIMLCLRSVGWRAGFPDEATEAPERMPPALNRLRDVYLESWQLFEDHTTLVEVFNLAWRVGMVSRALTWRKFVKGLDAARRSEFTYIVPAWLQEYLLAMK